MALILCAVLYVVLMISVLIGLATHHVFLSIKNGLAVVAETHGADGRAGIGQPLMRLPGAPVGKKFLFIALFILSPTLRASEPPAWEDKYKDQASQELSYERSVEVFPDYTWKERKVRKSKLLKMEALKKNDFGEFITYYNPLFERATLSAEILFANGKRFHHDKVQDKSKSGRDATYGDVRVVTLTLPRIEVGSEIELTEDRKCRKPFVPGAFSRDYFLELSTKPLKHMRLSITTPEGMYLSLIPLNGLGQPAVSEKDGKTTYAWTLNDLDAIDSENAMPPMEDMARRVVATTWKDWSDLDRYFAPMIDQATAATPEIRELALEVTKDAKTTDEKIQAVFNFIDDSVRYVSVNLGQNGLTPHAPLETIRNRYGDCKDRTALAVALLKAIDVKAYPVLVAPAWEDVRPEAPTWTYFDHMITAVQRQEGLYFVESTDGGYPYKDRHPGLDGSQIYIVDGKGGRRLTLPLADLSEPDGTSKGELWLQKDGSARVAYDTEVRREGLSGLRQTFRELFSMPEEKMRRELESIISGIFPGIEGVGFRIDGYKDRFGPITLHFTGTLQSAAIPNGPYLLYSPKAVDLREGYPEHERKHPLWFMEQEFTRNTTVIHLPPGFAVEYRPKDVSSVTGEGAYRRSWTQKGDTLTVVEDEKKIAGRYPKESYPAFRSAVVQLNKETSEMVILKAIPAGKGK